MDDNNIIDNSLPKWRWYSDVTNSNISVLLNIVNVGLLSNCTVTTQGEADHPCVSDQTECNRSPKPTVIPKLCTSSTIKRKLFSTLLDAPKWHFWEGGGHFWKIFICSLSMGRMWSTAKYKNIRTLLKFIALHPYPTSEDYKIFFPKLLTAYSATK